MQKTKFLKTPMACAMGLLMSNGVIAQEEASANNLSLEEVIVTAQRRSENLQDVPLSVSAITGDKIEKAGINTIADVMAYVPNLTTTETGISTQLFIRGVGTGNNQGFEQSVGMYIDGIYYGRQQLIRAPFLDLESVEVLRGPQSILFGKNSIAGAMNMRTKKPEGELEGNVSVMYEPETNQREITAGVSVPITDNFSARIAGRWYQEDGYIENEFIGKQDEPNRDERAVRLTLAYDNTENLSFTFKVEQDTFDVQGRQIEIVADTGYAAALFGAAGAVIDTELDYKRQTDAEEYSDNTLDNVTFNIEYQLGDITLSSTTGIVGYDFEEVCDCDYVSADILTIFLDEEYEQISQEIRLTSPGDETVDWIVGAFYQSSELDFSDEIRLSGSSLVASVRNTSVVRDYTTETEVYALFGQATWNASDVLRVTAGARYTSSVKDGSRALTIIPTNETTLGPAILPTYEAGFGIVPHSLAGNRDDSSFTPLVNIQWNVNDDAMIYASASTGFKAGGFDARSNTSASFEFEDEKATSYEMGLKTTLADGAAELNVAIFYTDYKDLQVSQFDGILGFTVGNAKESTVQGVEIDGRWRLTEKLIINYAASYLDFEFKDFDDGNCYFNQVPDSQTPGLCNYDGKTARMAPKQNLNIGAEYVQPLSGNLDIAFNVDLLWVSKQNVHENADPDWVIDAYTKVNARISLEANNWGVALVGKNLLDEEVITYAGNAPLSGSNGFGNQDTIYAFVERPRTIAIEASYKF